MQKQVGGGAPVSLTRWEVSGSEPERIKSGLINNIGDEGVSHDTDLTERLTSYRNEFWLNDSSSPAVFLSLNFGNSVILCGSVIRQTFNTDRLFRA